MSSNQNVNELATIFKMLEMYLYVMLAMDAKMSSRDTGNNVFFSLGEVFHKEVFSFFFSMSKLGYLKYSLNQIHRNGNF